MTTETKTEARERMSEQQFRKAALDFLAAHGVATIDLQKGELRVALEAAFREIDRSNASEASLTAALSALRAEHQRTVAELERTRTLRPQAIVDELRAALAEVTKERDEARVDLEQVRREWTAASGRMQDDRQRLNAALAASEEKARGMEQAIRRIIGERDFTHPPTPGWDECQCVPCDLKRALSPSAGPASEAHANDCWPDGPDQAGRCVCGAATAPASDEPKR